MRSYCETNQFIEKFEIKLKEMENFYSFFTATTNFSQPNFSSFSSQQTDNIHQFSIFFIHFFLPSILDPVLLMQEKREERNKIER